MATTTRSERYLAKVDRREPNECWPWLASTNPCGYGTFSGGIDENGVRQQLAHRFGYALQVGPIPSGLQVCHTCDNPPCQNPAHWFLGTHRENHEDKIKKGRQGPPVRLNGSTNPNAKLTDREIAEIRRRWCTGQTQTHLALAYGVAQSHISRIVNRRQRRQPNTSIPLDS